MKENSSNKKFTFLISENTYEDDSSSGSPYFAPPVDAPSPTFQEKEENPSSENTGDNASDNQHQSQPQENPSGSSQSGLYAVIQKGTAKCSFGTTPCGFKVSSHTLQYANGETTEHLIVTEEDVTFAKPAAPFTSCKADRNNSCSYAPDGKWQNTYSKIKVLGKKILTEESFLFCKSRSGKIEVKEHGQSQEVINAHFDNVELEELQMLSPLAGKPEDRKEIPQVKNIEVHLPQRKGDDAICKNTLAKDNSTKFNSAPQITVRKDEPMTFKVSSYYNKKADKNKVSWKVFDGKNFDSEKLELLEKGEELKINLDTYGIYRVLAYGNPEKSKDARCIIHVEVAKNKLVGEGMKAIGENFIGKKIARNFPVNVQPFFLFPPNTEEKSRLKMEVKYGTSHFNHIFTPETGVVFTPDSNGEYTVVTTYTQEDGTRDIKEVTYKTVSNSISEITAFPQSKYYRPGTTITFKLSKLKFGIIPDENTDLLGIENKDIKWKLNDDIAQQGSRTFTRTFSQTGKYIVEAYVNKADGKGNDTHSFEIKKNEVIGFKGVLSLGLIVGKSREIEVETLMQYNKALDGDVTWKSTTPGLRITSVSGAKATITADREIWLGAGILTAQLGGKSATILVFASKAEIKRWCFTDSHNLYKRYAGWGETINVVLESTPLISGEKVKLHLMEYDSPTDANYIKDLGEVAFNEKGIARTSFKTDDIKSTLNKLYFERGGYEMFFAIEKKTGGITFAETKEKTRAGKLSYYPEKTSEVTGNEKGKFLFIDSKKDVVEARYYDTQGNRLWKVLRYGEPVKVHIQTRNMAGTKVKWQIYQNIVKGEDKKVGPEQEFTIGGDETLRLNIDTNVLKNSIAESERKKIAMFYCIITEADGDKFKYPKDLAISQILDTKKVNFYHHLKLSEALDHINELANNNAPLIIGEPLEMGGNNGPCVCKEYDLIWGAKVSCEFRKKVVEISKRLGKDPNTLMAAMALETNGTFSPTRGKGTSYVGLIQFGEAAAQSVGTTQEALLKMTAVQQLDYVEKYLEKKKDKLKTLTDFYLSILMPVDVGKGDQPNHVVFDNEYPLAYKNEKLTDLSRSRHYGYRQNPAFLFEGKLHQKITVTRSGGKKQTFSNIYEEKRIWYENGEKNYNGSGKTYIWEIAKNLDEWYKNGKINKVTLFTCSEKTIEKAKILTEKGTWNVIITEQYTGKTCTHEDKTPKRSNCRKGKIEVYDHNNKVVLTISECLLEGAGGTNRMKTNNDTPFGTYKINTTIPFYHSTSSNKASYGPNPRLVFEPIKGSGDEADKSGRANIRIHGGRQEGYAKKMLKRAHGCIRVWDEDAKRLYDWWVEYSKKNPSIKPGKVTIKE